MSTKIKINAHELRRRFCYDPATGVFTRRVAGGHKFPAGGVAGGVQTNGYIYVHILGRKYKAHRLAWLYVHGEWPASEIDHINRNKADNSIANLRPTSRSENTLNAVKARKTNKSGLLGVSSCGRRFISRLHVNGVCSYLGTFATAEAAHAAYMRIKQEIL